MTIFSFQVISHSTVSTNQSVGMNYGAPCYVTRKNSMFEIILYQENGTIMNSLNSTEVETEEIKLLTHPADLECISSGGKNNSYKSLLGGYRR